jgi:hypothetical protein
MTMRREHEGFDVCLGRPPLSCVLRTVDRDRMKEEG